MKETFGVRLDTYQKEKLKEIAEKKGMSEAELIRDLIDRLITEYHHESCR